MNYLCKLLIRFYRKFLSPLKPHPTCRFNPCCPAGYDPVPMTGFKTMGWRYKKPKKSEREGNDDASEM